MEQELPPNIWKNVVEYELENKGRSETLELYNKLKSRDADVDALDLNKMNITSDEDEDIDKLSKQLKNTYFTSPQFNKKKFAHSLYVTVTDKRSPYKGMEGMISNFTPFKLLLYNYLYFWVKPSEYIAKAGDKTFDFHKGQQFPTTKKTVNVWTKPGWNRSGSEIVLDSKFEELPDNTPNKEKYTIKKKETRWYTDVTNKTFVGTQSWPFDPAFDHVRIKRNDEFFWIKSDEYVPQLGDETIETHKGGPFYTTKKTVTAWFKPGSSDGIIEDDRYDELPGWYPERDQYTIKRKQNMWFADVYDQTPLGIHSWPFDPTFDHVRIKRKGELFWVKSDEYISQPGDETVETHKGEAYPTTKKAVNVWYKPGDTAFGIVLDTRFYELPDDFPEKAKYTIKKSEYRWYSNVNVITQNWPFDPAFDHILVERHEKISIKNLSDVQLMGRINGKNKVKILKHSNPELVNGLFDIYSFRFARAEVMLIDGPNIIVRTAGLFYKDFLLKSGNYAQMTKFDTENSELLHVRTRLGTNNFENQVIPKSSVKEYLPGMSLSNSYNQQQVDEIEYVAAGGEAGGEAGGGAEYLESYNSSTRFDNELSREEQLVTTTVHNILSALDINQNMIDLPSFYTTLDNVLDNVKYKGDIYNSVNIRYIIACLVLYNVIQSPYNILDIDSVSSRLFTTIFKLNDFNSSNMNDNVFIDKNSKETVSLIVKLIKSKKFPELIKLLLKFTDTYIQSILYLDVSLSLLGNQATNIPLAPTGRGRRVNKVLHVHQLVSEPLPENEIPIKWGAENRELLIQLKEKVDNLIAQTQSEVGKRYFTHIRDNLYRAPFSIRDDKLPENIKKYFESLYKMLLDTITGYKLDVSTLINGGELPKQELPIRWGTFNEAIINDLKQKLEASATSQKEPNKSYFLYIRDNLHRAPFAIRDDTYLPENAKNYFKKVYANLLGSIQYVSGPVGTEPPEKVITVKRKGTVGEAEGGGSVSKEARTDSDSDSEKDAEYYYDDILDAVRIASNPGGEAVPEGKIRANEKNTHPVHIIKLLKEKGINADSSFEPLIKRAISQVRNEIAVENQETRLKQYNIQGSGGRSSFDPPKITKKFEKRRYTGLDEDDFTDLEKELFGTDKDYLSSEYESKNPDFNYTVNNIPKARKRTLRHYPGIKEAFGDVWKYDEFFNDLYWILPRNNEITSKERAELYNNRVKSFMNKYPAQAGKVKAFLIEV